MWVLARRFALAALLCWSVLAPSARVSAQTGDLGRLLDIARAGQGGASDRVVAPDPAYRPVVLRQHRERVASAVAAAAIALIALGPTRRGEVEAAARAAAPEVAEEISRRIARAFPRPATLAPASRAGPRFVQPAVFGVMPSHLGARPPVRERGAEAEHLAALEAWLVASIASNPSGLDAAVRTAVASRPDARRRLVRTASGAFPGFAGAIQAAAAGGAVPAVARADAPPPSTRVPAVARAGGPTPIVYRADRARARPSGAARPGVAPEATWDPLEPANRVIFAVNEGIDFLILRPVAWLYNKTTPDPVIHAVRRFFANLRSPVIIANDVLQLEFEDAAVALGRFGVNTTVGVLGLFDVATDFGLPAHHADFGQTLHSYGLGPGPYLVLPIIGPSTARDGAGTVVDIFLDPLTYLIPRPEAFAVTGAKVISIREELLDPLDELKASSIDYYAALRGAYYQKRAVELSKRVSGWSVPRTSDEATDALFDEAN